MRGVGVLSLMGSGAGGAMLRVRLGRTDQVLRRLRMLKVLKRRRDEAEYPRTAI